MKIYRVYCNSMHKVEYTLGYFLQKEEAEKFLARQGMTPSGPHFGLEEVLVIE